MLSRVYTLLLCTDSTAELVSILTARTQRLVNFGLDRYFSTRFAYIAHQSANHTTGLPPPVVAINRTSRRQWKKALQDIRKIQKLASAGSGLLIPCVLEVNGSNTIKNNNVTDYLLHSYKSAQ